MCALSPHTCTVADRNPAVTINSDKIERSDARTNEISLSKVVDDAEAIGPRDKQIWNAISREVSDDQTAGQTPTKRHDYLKKRQRCCRRSDKTTRNEPMNTRRAERSEKQSRRTPQTEVTFKTANSASGATEHVRTARRSQRIFYIGYRQYVNVAVA